jgi:release factor glutamine methyltransferase
MKTLKAIAEIFKKELPDLYDPKEIDSLFNMAIADAANISAARIKAFPELEVSNEQHNNINQIISELKKGKPIQYILGHAEFFGLSFKVNPSVLIPRPETEELVEWILSSVKNEQKTVNHILDIGTGSGCIAISLKKSLPDSSVSAMDISGGALKTAEENAKLNSVDLVFIQADILDAGHEVERPKYDMIVSNPPYVTLEDKKQMHTNVTDFEPHTALFVPEDDPLIFYKAITDFACKHLEKGGLLFFEINEIYGEQIVELLNRKSFINIELRKDLSGRDRMIKAIRQG